MRTICLLILLASFQLLPAQSDRMLTIGFNSLITNKIQVGIEQGFARNRLSLHPTVGYGRALQYLDLSGPSQVFDASLRIKCYLYRSGRQGLEGAYLFLPLGYYQEFGRNFGGSNSVLFSRFAVGGIGLGGNYKVGPRLLVGASVFLAATYGSTIRFAPDGTVMRSYFEDRISLGMSIELGWIF